MRDVDRLREKIQISLDDRQIAVLAVCALLLLGGVFSLGLLVGKRLTASAPQSAKANDLAALDEQQEQAAREPPPRMKVSPAAAPRVVPLKPPVVAETLPAEELDRDPDEQPAPEQGKLPGEASPAQPVKPAPPSAKATPPARSTPPQTNQQAQAAIVPTPREPVQIEPPPKPRIVEPALKPVAVLAPPRNLGQFTVQIGASQDRADAQRLESRARLAGLKPYLIEARLGNKGTWYRVRVGAFNDKNAADNYRRDVERELRLTAMVMPAR